MATVSTWPTFANQALALQEAFYEYKDTLIAMFPEDTTVITTNYDNRPVTEDDIIAFYLYTAIVDADIEATLSSFLYDGTNAEHFPGFGE